MEEVILLFNIKVSLPSFNKYLSKWEVIIFKGPDKEKDMDNFCSEFAKTNGIDKSILTLNYMIIPQSEYLELLSFTDSFCFSDLKKKEIVYILLKFKEKYGNIKNS